MFSAAGANRCHSGSRKENWNVSHRPFLGRQRPAILDLPFFLVEIQSLLFQGLLHLPMSRVKLLLRLFQLGLFFLHLLLEDHLHLGFHLGQFGFVEHTLFLHTQCRTTTMKRETGERDENKNQRPYFTSLKTLESCATPMLSSFSVLQFS